VRLRAPSASVSFSARDLLGAESARQVSWLLMARPLMMLWFAGGLVVELWIALHGRDAAAPGLALAVALAAQVFGVLIGLSARRVPPAWTGHAILVSATAAVSVVNWAARPADAGLELIYLWATPYAFILVRRRWAVVHVALAGAAWLATETLVPPTASHAGRWLLVLATLAAISLVSWHLIVSLRGSRNLLNRAFEDSPLGMAFADPAGRLIAVNGALRDLLGRDAEDVMGVPAADLLGDLSHTGSRRLLRAAGTEAWVELVRSPVLDDAGHLACWSLQVLDVTARHEAEAALRADAAQARWVDEVRAALDEDRIVLYAQPLFSIARGAPVSHELLARLRRRDGTIVAPGAFMPAVERFGLAPQFDARVLGEAARIAAGGRRVHVNLSAQSVGHPEPIAALRRALHETGADPALLTLEITETALSDDLDACEAFGREITALGCRLALDDFGTGYGTLTYLASLPVTEIKIDRQFVSRLCADQGAVEMVRAVVALARGFRAMTVAEGVEDRETLERVRELGIDVAQGFLLGRPAPLAGAPEAGAPSAAAA
jgi:EAL domain-containing protein (putative c-di-GMP-specific phosphodiesterase class I)